MVKAMRKLSAVILFGFLAGLLLAQTANVAGDWEMKSTSPRGERVSQISFAQDGEKITVTMAGGRGGDVTGEGTVKGNDIEWTITRSTPQGEFSITYKGKVDGKTMKGEVAMGDFGTMEWSATKK